MAATDIPHLRKTKTSSQLIVNGKPFLMLSAELHNSTLSSAEYMATDKIWQNMKEMHINTLLGSVSWEQIEPREGEFDFSNLEAVILAAREHGMKLVLLWFGSFKNALSTYVPAWVKRDVKRFPRVHTIESGNRRRTLELLSPFSENCWTADARAFEKLMTRLKEFDSHDSTVVMVQVENETGLLGDYRDRSKIAERMYREPVPSDLLNHLQAEDTHLHPEFTKRFPELKTSAAGSSWKQVFGSKSEINAEEMFMADAFSKYIQHVASAGKAAYPIPLYANVWLNFDDPDALDVAEVDFKVGGGAKAGVYPSGGPVPHTMDIYKFNAPALDFISPDLYFHDYEQTCINYRHGQQPLFIPEQRRDEYGMRRVWLAYGTYLALGCSPFGIDSLQAVDSATTKHYRLLHSLRNQILEAQAERPEDMFGFYFDELEEGRKIASEKSWTKTIAGFEVIVERAFVFGKPGPSAGLVIHQGDGKFLCAGWGFNVSFKSTDPKSTFTGILHAEEKEVDAESSEVRTAKILGGDETRSGEFLIMPNEDPDYGGFPIAVTIPARTGIAECWAYSLEETEDDF